MTSEMKPASDVDTISAAKKISSSEGGVEIAKDDIQQAILNDTPILDQEHFLQQGSPSISEEQEGTTENDVNESAVLPSRIMDTSGENAPNSARERRKMAGGQEATSTSHRGSTDVAAEAISSVALDQGKSEDISEGNEIINIAKEEEIKAVVDGNEKQELQADAVRQAPANDSFISSSLDRELAGPPTPLKSRPQSLSADKVEVSKLAKAFDANVRVTNYSESSTQPSTDTIQSNEERGELNLPLSTDSTSTTSSKSPRSGGIRIGKGPPPTTQASEEKPFDFNRFLEQMRNKSAGPVGEYVRSFIKGFTKKPYRVSDQTKLIFDFLDFISIKMRECEVWSRLSTLEFENATEAMEKLLMNRLYNYTFSPAVQKEGKWSVQTDDLERDRILKQRIRLFGWISEEHLDVPIGPHSKGFIDFAMDELLKINHYKAPRDKVICILNSCKVIFGLIRHLSSEENADTFIPILIFVVLRSNPDHLISNVEYISRFRNPERLSSESGYYLSSLMGAIAFIETMDYTSLSNITQEQFESNVEAAVEKISALPESVESSPAHQQSSARQGMGEKSESLLTPSQSSSSTTPLTVQGSSSNGEESARTLPISAGAVAIAEDTKAFFQRTGEAARAGIGASLGKPIGALGRLFQESLDGPRTPGGSSPAATSGRGTPESPPPGINAGPSSARSRMWGLFGVDEDEMQRRQEAAAAAAAQSGTASRLVSSSSLNFGSWGRNMRDEEEPQTPISEELRQGRFTILEGADRGQKQQTLESQLANAPRIQRQQRMIPQRNDSIDPYSVQDDEVMASGVRTPDGDGSDNELSSPTHATTAGRPRLTDLGGFLPSFLTEQSNSSSSSSGGIDQQQSHQHQRSQLQHKSQISSDVLDKEEAAIATAEIEQAHLAAGVETLKSIFPDMDPSVCKLVLEGCQGDLRKTIDKLLEM